MADHYFNASERMRDSSIMLHKSNQWHNSCYLAGYVVENYLKIFFYLGLAAKSGKGNLGHNISDLNTQVQYALTSSPMAAGLRKYVIDVSVECGSVLSKWKPEMRYSDKASCCNESDSIDFQLESSKCFDQIIAMTLDSILS